MAEILRLKKATLMWVTVLALMVALTGSSIRAEAASPGITHFSITPNSTQAGGHPDVVVDVKYSVESEEECKAVPCLEGRVVSTHFPTGFIGSPHVVPRCTLAELSEGDCPPESQIGIFEGGGGGEFFFFPAYNMETSPDQAGLIGSVIPLVSSPIFLNLSGRTDSDYGLDSVTTPLLRSAGISAVKAFLWGVPADSSHDFQRFATPLTGLAMCRTIETGCEPGAPFQSPTFAKSAAPLAPYLQAPTTCGLPLTSRAEVEYYGGATVQASTPYPPSTGCNQLSFDPSLTVKATTSSADTASGIDVDLRVPQTQSPYTPSPSELRTSRVTLPPGFSINPNAADGKVACSDADTSIGTLDAAHCPEFSKIGTLTLDVAALPGPIAGALYIGAPKAGDRYRLVLTADGFATHLKIVGSAHLDPQTGQVELIFEDLPQQPLQDINLHFFGSERGLLATHGRCGSYPVRAEFVPWDSALPTYQSVSYLTIDSGPGGTSCPSGSRALAPRLSAGTANSTAGVHAPFTVVVNRADGEQNLTGLTVKTPPGFSATLRGIPYCPEGAIASLAVFGYQGLAERASPACPIASQIGTAVVGAGAGSHPVYVDGRVYLAGPYKGAPLSLLVVVPAVSGPYDLGSVAVRAALNIDQTTAQVTAVSDPLPQILDGIPLRTRFIQVSLDRPNFALNPTNCDPFEVQSTISGDEGAAVPAAAHFQVANCADLSFGPRLALSFKGGTKRASHPALTAALAYPGGGRSANIETARVTLPDSQILDNAHISAPCTRVQFAAEQCPPGSQIGFAKVKSPILDDPLEGAVYLRSSSNLLPDLVVDLRGKFHVVLVARLDAVNDRIRTTFESLPDVPVSSFTLSLFGGEKKGLLVNSKNLCAKPRKAMVKIGGQNGKRATEKAIIATPCSKRLRHKRQKRTHKGSTESRKAVR